MTFGISVRHANPNRGTRDRGVFAARSFEIDLAVPLDSQVEMGYTNSEACAYGAPFDLDKLIGELLLSNRSPVG